MLDALFTPSSIAVVGVSSKPTKVGHQIFANLQSFEGQVYPVNPKHKQILGKPCYPSLLSIPHPVDVVVIATPTSTVGGIVQECIDKKVRAVIVVTAGFAESSKEGKRLQERIASLLWHNHIALVGPNTLGIINTHIHLNASFAGAHIERGNIALISQSGALLTTIFSSLTTLGIGCSFAISLGNEAGVTAIDALDYAASDPHTHVIGLYVESLTNGKAFFAACKKVSAKKPILILKGGMSKKGQKASLSHTAALATDATLLLEGQHQFGYTCTHTIEQFVETLFFLDHLNEKPLPENLMILTNAGGPGVTATDLASSSGIPLASWSPSSVSRWARELPRIRPGNPTDLLGDATTATIDTALTFMEDDTAVDSCLLIVTPQAVTDIPSITQLLSRKKIHKPLIVAMMGGVDVDPYRAKLKQKGLTVVAYPDDAIDIFSCIARARKAQRVDRSAKLMEELEHSLGKTQSLPHTRASFPLQSDRIEEVLLMLEAYGFALPASAIVSSKQQLDELDTLNPERVYPLIAKTTNVRLKHKAAVGAVVKDIRSKQEAQVAFEHLRKFGDRIILQEVITDAIEVIVGCKRDPTFGEFIAVGSGGTMTNILADRAYIFLPASQREVRAALRRTKLYPLLSAEQRSLVLLSIERFIRLFTQHPEIEELEINPLMITSHTAYVADVKVELLTKH